jgi:branched-chain amino acid transport system ATP-binding protein
MNAFLSANDVAVQYGAVAALQGISVNVKENEIVALIGPNGAGKTSLLMAIAGAVKLVGGSIQFNDEMLNNLPPEKVVRKGLALVPENREIFTKLTVLENLLIGASYRNDRAGIQKDLEYVQALFPKLKSREHAPAGIFSGGEQQMLAIARALMSRPKLLMLDEPSLGLAPVVTDSVYEAIIQLRDEGMTIMLVEQNAKRAMSICDRAYLMSAGQIEFFGTATEIAENGGLDAAYFGIGEGANLAVTATQ